MKSRYFSSLLSNSPLLNLVALVLTAGTFLFSVSAAHAETSSDPVGRVKSFKGNITVTRAYTKESLKVEGNLPLMFRDVNETEFDSQVELEFIDGSTLFIGEDTVLTIDEMVFEPKTGRRSAKLNLKSGTIRLNAAKNTNPDSKFEVTTPSLVAGLRGTELTVSVDKAGNARVITLEGAVAVWKRGAPKGSRKEVLIVAGMTTGMASGDAVPTNAKPATAKQIQSVTSATRVGGPTLKNKSGKVKTASAAPGSKAMKVPSALKNRNRLGGDKSGSFKSDLKANSRLASIGVARSTAAQAAKNVAKGVARNVAKGVARNAAKSAAKNAAKEAANNAAKNAVNEVAKNAASKAANNNAKNNGNNGSNGKAKGKKK